MENDNFGRYKIFIVDMMIKYRELFPIAERIYDGIPITCEADKLAIMRFELGNYIGIDKYISDIIDSPLWVSYFVVASTKKNKEYRQHINLLEKAMYNMVLSYYVERFLGHEKHKIVDQMMKEL